MSFLFNVDDDECRFQTVAASVKQLLLKYSQQWYITLNGGTFIGVVLILMCDVVELSIFEFVEVENMNSVKLRMVLNKWN